MLKGKSRRGRSLVQILLGALLVALLATCTFGFIPGNPIFCSSFCNKCQGCYETEFD